MGKIKVREIEKTEYPVLEDFLYNAIYIPEGEAWPPRKIIFEPEIYVYVKDFGLDTKSSSTSVFTLQSQGVFLDIQANHSRTSSLNGDLFILP